MSAAYFGLTNAIFAPLACSTDKFSKFRGGKKYVWSIPWIECSSGEHALLSWVSYAFLSLYVIGIPALFATLLKCLSIPKYQHNLLHWFGFFFRTYKDEYRSFCLIWLGRRVLLSVAISFTNGFAQVFFFVSILLVSILFHHFVNVFKEKIVHSFELAVNLMLLLTYVVLYTTAGKDAASVRRSGIVVVVIVLNVGMLLAFAVVTALHFWKVIRRRLPHGGVSLSTCSHVKCC